MTGVVGTGGIIGGGGSPGNPTASIGLAAVNGSASTLMRSDAAPPLSQAIVPNWSGIHQWSLTEPRLLLNESDLGADLKLWDIDLQGGILRLRTRTDADGAGVDAIAVTRGATTAISNLAFGNATNNPTFTFLGNGATTFTGNVTASSGRMTAQQFVPSATSVPTNGMYLPAGNTLGFSSNTVARVSIDSVGQFALTTVGSGLSIKEGANAKMGTATLAAGTVVVSTTAVTATSRIFLTAQSLGTVTVGQGLAVSARTAGTSFTISSTSITDTSVVAWMIVEPSP